MIINYSVKFLSLTFQSYQAIVINKATCPIQNKKKATKLEFIYKIVICNLTFVFLIKLLCGTLQLSLKKKNSYVSDIC